MNWYLRGFLIAVIFIFLLLIVRYLVKKKLNLKYTLVWFATIIVSSPAIVPTTSLNFKASMAAATAIAIPATVRITKIFCAISMERKPS